MAGPVIRLFNRQKTHRPDLRWLRRLIRVALPACLAAARQLETPLRTQPEIEVTIVDDEQIARVHGEFLDDPGPTDVITFHHGEILVSADTAVRQGAEHGQPLDVELGLYIIHGLLHLGGWDDHEPDEAARMAEMQSAILQDALARVG